MRNKPKRPDVVAIYCPLWHNYPHASSWKGYGWCEWELVKTAIPRFPGHYQPLQPTWGFFDESDPVWAEREIELASKHGIDVMLFDWYWYSGVRIMEEALEHGFLRARNRKRLKFALMWANHDWADYFPAPFGKPWNMWLPSRHCAADLEHVIQYCATQYFNRPNYWQVGGKLFFSVFQPVKLVEELGGPAATRRIFMRINRWLRAHDLPPIHWNGMTWVPEPVTVLKEAGFSSTTSYNIVSGKPSPELVANYADVMDSHHDLWSRMTQTALPYIPNVTMGWDVTPRCEKDIRWPFPPSPITGNLDYPYCHLVTENTPDRFEELCVQAREHVSANSPQPFAVMVNAWNEWTEGSYLLPEKRTGTMYLEALQKAFE